MIDWASVGTHSFMFLFGAATGAASTYFADRFTDQRRAQEARRTADARWRKLRSAMPELIARLAVSHESHPHVRELYVLSRPGVMMGGSDRPRFTLFQSEQLGLLDHLVALEEAGYLTDVTTKNVPIYRMTDALIERLDAEPLATLDT